MSAWVVSETRPGYRTKTLQYGNCTIIINRPILEPDEQKKRELQVCKGVELGLRDYILRKEIKS